MLRVALVLMVSLAGCWSRQCGVLSVPSAIDAGTSVMASFDRERCRRELAHASVAVPPGLGAIDGLMPTCGADGSLVIWTLRGHTLSRVSRSRVPGSSFAIPEVVATGADRVGPVAVDGVLGPVAWRTPTTAIEELDADEWWVAFIDSEAVPGHRVRRGSVLMPPGVVGLGVLAPVARTEEGVEVMGTIARTGMHPRIVRYTVHAPRDEVESLSGDPEALCEGELKAYETVHRVALALAVEPEGRTVLRALQRVGTAMVQRGRIGLSRGHVLVVPRGVARGGTSLFVFSEFDVATRGSSCLVLGDSLCVVPGAVVLVRVDASGVTTLTVAQQGLVDTFTLDDRDRAVVFYVLGNEQSQRAARIDLDRGMVERLNLVPTDELPPLDHPALVRCGREPWLTAEVLIDTGGDAGGVSTERGVIAVPLECVLSR